MEIIETVKSSAGFTVRDRAWMILADARSVKIIGAKKDFPSGLAEEFLEDRFDGWEVGVIIEMLLFDVKNDGVFWMVEGESSIAFVSFGDKMFSMRIPVGVGPENRDFCTHVMGRREVADLEDMGGHRGSGRFAVHPADDDALFTVHEGG